MANPRRKPSYSQRAADSAERRAEMYRLHVVERLDQTEIGKRFGITQQSVSEQIRRAIADRSTLANDETKAVELAKLDANEREIMAVLRRKHLTVSHGRVVTAWDDDKQAEVPVIDDAPVLKAIDRLLAIAKHRADLLGLKAPTRVSVEAENLSAEIAGLLAAAFGQDGEDGATPG